VLGKYERCKPVPTSISEEFSKDHCGKEPQSDA
jgi:hypothetical protein